MTRDECTSEWYKRRSAVTTTREQHAKLAPQPRFTAPDGTVVQAISLDGAGRYAVTRRGMFVALAKDITELQEYVDLGALRMEVKR